MVEEKQKKIGCWATMHSQRCLCIVAKMVKKKKKVLLKVIVFYCVGGGGCYLL